MTSGYTLAPFVGIDGEIEEEDFSRQQRSVTRRGLSVRRVLPLLPLAGLLAAAIGVYQVMNGGKKTDTPSQPGTMNELVEVAEDDFQHEDALGQELYEESEDSTQPPSTTTTLWRPTSIWGWIWVLVVRPEYFAGNPEAHKAMAKTIGRILGIPWRSIKIWLRPRGGWGRGLLGQNNDMGSVDVEFWVDPSGDDVDLEALADKETNSDLAVDTIILNEELNNEGVGADFPDSEVKDTVGKVANGGIAACSGHDFNKQQCMAVGCCTYDDKDKICHSAVGSQLCVPVNPCDTTQTPGPPNPCDTTQTPGPPNPCGTTQAPTPPSPCDTTQAASPRDTTKPSSSTKPSFFRSIFR